MNRVAACIMHLLLAKPGGDQRLDLAQAFGL
jgi:hypothetical protein